MMRIAIIIGSTRPGRKAEVVAKWVYEIARKRSDGEFELVDIKDYNLPLLDEPMSPMMGQYTHQHTKEWSAKIASFDAKASGPPDTTTGPPGRSRKPMNSLYTSGFTKPPESSAKSAHPGKAPLSNCA